MPLDKMESMPCGILCQQLISPNCCLPSKVPRAVSEASGSPRGSMFFYVSLASSIVINGDCGRSVSPQLAVMQESTPTPTRRACLASTASFRTINHPLSRPIFFKKISTRDFLHDNRSGRDTNGTPAGQANRLKLHGNIEGGTMEQWNVHQAYIRSRARAGAIYRCSTVPLFQGVKKESKNSLIALDHRRSVSVPGVPIHQMNKIGGGYVGH